MRQKHGIMYNTNMLPMNKVTNNELTNYQDSIQ